MESASNGDPVLFHYSIEQSRPVPIVVTEDSSKPLPAGEAPRVRLWNALDHPIAQDAVQSADAFELLRSDRPPGNGDYVEPPLDGRP